MTRFAALGALCIAALAYDAHVASAATTVRQSVPLRALRCLQTSMYNAAVPRKF